MDFRNEDRAPLLFIAGGEDNLMPPAVNPVQRQALPPHQLGHRLQGVSGPLPLHRGPTWSARGGRLRPRVGRRARGGTPGSLSVANRLFTHLPRVVVPGSSRGPVRGRGFAAPPRRGTERSPSEAEEGSNGGRWVASHTRRSTGARCQSTSCPRSSTPRRSRRPSAGPDARSRTSWPSCRISAWLEVRGGPGAGQISGALILGHGAEPEVLRSGAGLWGLLRGTAARVRQGQASTARIRRSYSETKTPALVPPGSGCYRGTSPAPCAVTYTPASFSHSAPGRGRARGAVRPTAGKGRSRKSISRRGSG